MNSNYNKKHQLSRKLIINATILGLLGGTALTILPKQSQSIQTVQAASAEKAKLTKKAYIYNKKGHRLELKAYKKGKRVKVYGTKYIKHRKYYRIGSGLYIVAANAKFIKSKLPNNVSNSKDNNSSTSKPVEDDSSSNKLYKVGEFGDCNLTYSPATRTVHISAYGENNTLGNYDESIADKINGAKLNKGNNLKISEVEHISIDTNVSLNEYSSYYLFANFANLQDISGLEKVYAGQCTDFDSMFANDPKLEKLDLSSWDLYALEHEDDVTTKNMFFGDSGLTELNLTGWDISNVSDAKGMFDGVNPAAIKGLIQKAPKHN